MAEQLYILRPPGWQEPAGYVDMRGVVVKDEDGWCEAFKVGDIFSVFEKTTERDGVEYEEQTHIRSIRQVLLHQGEILIWAEAETLEVAIDRETEDEPMYALEPERPDDAEYAYFHPEEEDEA